MRKNYLEKDKSSKQELVKNFLTSQNPFCVLPQEYFEEILDKDGISKKKKMLSISSWDGREIFTLERVVE